MWVMQYLSRPYRVLFEGRRLQEQRFGLVVEALQVVQFRYQLLRRSRGLQHRLEVLRGNERLVVILRVKEV